MAIRKERSDQPNNLLLVEFTQMSLLIHPHDIRLECAIYEEKKSRTD
jgi:hypothetical protein